MLKFLVVFALSCAGHSFAQPIGLEEPRRSRLFLSLHDDDAKIAEIKKRFFDASTETGEISVIVELELPAIISVADQLANPQDKLRYEEMVRVAQAKFRQAVQALVPNDPHLAVKVIKGLPFVQVWADKAMLQKIFEAPGVVAINEEAQGYPALNQTIPQIGGDVAFNLGATGSGQVVVVLDSGVESSHPFFATSRVIDQECFSSGSTQFPSPICSSAGLGEPISSNFPEYWHGTAMAGVIAGASVIFDGVTLRGAAPNADIISVQVHHQISCSGSPSAYCSTVSESDLTSALMWVYNLPSSYNIAAVNISSTFGSNGGVAATPYGSASTCDTVYNDLAMAVSKLVGKGISVVAASGNSGHSGPPAYTVMYPPACLSQVISVAAVDKANNFAGYSNVSANLSIFAPGGCDTQSGPYTATCGVLSSLPGGTYGNMDPDAGLTTKPLSGTSQAAAHVSGAIAAMRSISVASNAAPPNVILARLQATGNTPNSTPIAPPSVVAGVKILNLGAAATAISVIPSAGPHGSISPSAQQSILFYNTTSFSVTPNTGYVATVAGTCGGSLIGTTYTTSPVVAPCTVNVTFALSSATQAAIEIILDTSCDVGTDPTCS